jgi:cation transport ATPase
MYKFLTKNGQTISFFVGLAITVIFLVIVFTGLEEFSMLDPKTTARESNLFNFGITASVALIVICTIGMIAFILLNIVTNFKGNIRLLIGVGIVGALFLVMYMGADFEPEGTFLGNLLIKNKITAGQNGFIVGGLWTAVILTVVAFI